MFFEAHVTISPVRGGFIVRYPSYVDGRDTPFMVTEITTTSGKAMRVAKAAVEAFSLVKKTADDAAEA